MGNIHSYRKDFGLIIVGAMIFAASFLWKDLIVDVRDKYFPASSGLIERLIFTVIVTVIIAIVAVELKNYFGLETGEIESGHPGEYEFKDEKSHDYSMN